MNPNQKLNKSVVIPTMVSLSFMAITSLYSLLLVVFLRTIEKGNTLYALFTFMLCLSAFYCHELVKIAKKYSSVTPLQNYYIPTIMFAITSIWIYGVIASQAEFNHGSETIWEKIQIMMLLLAFTSNIVALDAIFSPLSLSKFLGLSLLKVFTLSATALLLVSSKETNVDTWIGVVTILTLTCSLIWKTHTMVQLRTKFL